MLAALHIIAHLVLANPREVLHTDPLYRSREDRSRWVKATDHGLKSYRIKTEASLMPVHRALQKLRLLPSRINQVEQRPRVNLSQGRGSSCSLGVFVLWPSADQYTVSLAPSSTRQHFICHLDVRE